MKDWVLLGIGGAVLFWGWSEFAKAEKNKVMVQPDNLNNQEPASSMSTPGSEFYGLDFI